MKKAIMILLVVLVVVLLALILLDKKPNKETVSGRERVEPTQVLTKYKTQENSEGSVTVEVTPLVISAKENVIFSVSIDTHSIGLDDNLRDISILFDDMGNKYRAISWDGGTGGHHLEGKLIFPNVSSGTKEIRLIISGLAGIKKEFKWAL